jgi:hypothetical protein
MPGQTFTFVSAGQFDPASDAYAVTPARFLDTFTKEIVLWGSCLNASAGEAGTYPIYIADAPTALVACYARIATNGSTNLQIVTAIGSTPLQSATTVATSAFTVNTSTDTTISAGLNSGSTRLTQLQQGDAFALRTSVVGPCFPIGVVTLVLQRF